MSDKIYKTVTSDRLEQACRDGWQLEGEPRKESRFVGAEHTRYLTSEEMQRNRNSYGYGGSQSAECKHVQFGDALIFVVWKERDTLTREQQLEQQLHEAQDKLRESRNVAQQLVEQKVAHDTLRDESRKVIDEKNAAIETQRQSIEALTVSNRKLETDIATARRAVGELRWKEVVG